MHGILVPGGFGERGSEGKILAAKFARERKVPYFGICFGMQMACIEAARSLAGIDEASSTEFGPTKEPVVGLMTEWLKGNMLEKRRETGDLGGTMRLGAYRGASSPAARRSPRSTATPQISERHRHRYEVNIDYKERLEDCGLVFAGMSPDGVLPETIEYPDHPVVHRRAVSSGAEEPAARAASAVCQLHLRRGGAEPAGLGGRPQNRWVGLRRTWPHDILAAMTKLEQIEKSVAELSEDELKAFAKWFEELQADLWDRQIEADAKAGKLDKFAERALAEHRAGRTRPL